MPADVHPLLAAALAAGDNLCSPQDDMQALRDALVRYASDRRAAVRMVLALRAGPASAIALFMRLPAKPILFSSYTHTPHLRVA